MVFLHTLIIIFQILTCLLIIFSRNPIHSILFLILFFFLSSATLILFRVEFFSLLLIIIYVGAIAVLFLFVVMMLQIKSEPFKFLNLILSLFVFFTLFILEISYHSNMKFLDFNIIPNQNLFFFCLENIKDIDLLGQYLFNYNPSLILVAGLLLLVSLIGSIILTIDLNKSNQSNVVFRRLSRSDNFVVFF